MKIRFPLGLAAAIGITILSATPLMAQAPAPTASPSPSPLGFPGPAPTPPPAVPRDPPFPVPPPQPERLLQPSAPPPAARFRSQPPSSAEIARAIPRVEIWRAGAVSPQRPVRHRHRLETALVADNSPVVVRLQFDPLAAGKIVAITGATRITVNPPRAFFPVPTAGECLVSLQLDESAARGHVTFSCEGQTTTLLLARGSLDRVVAKEAADGGVVR